MRQQAVLVLLYISRDAHSKTIVNCHACIHFIWFGTCIRVLYINIYKHKGKMRWTLTFDYLLSYVSVIAFCFAEPSKLEASFS